MGWLRRVWYVQFRCVGWRGSRDGNAVENETDSEMQQNLSQFLIIGRMSALTFNVASNVKTVIILSYGWVSEGRILTLTDSLGIILALGGATLYSQLSQR